MIQRAEVRICMRGQPAIDTGGVRRQFFSVVFKTLAHSEKFSMFDGPGDRLRPAFRMSNLSSGMFRVLGQMVAHSLILDGQGFPYLSECIYYYLAGLIDRAMTLVTDADLSEQVKTLVQEVCLHANRHKFVFGGSPYICNCVTIGMGAFSLVLMEGLGTKLNIYKVPL